MVYNWAILHCCIIACQDAIFGITKSTSENKLFAEYSFDVFLTFFLVLMQVILVGHDFGGACTSYAMELFPHKISKAVFIAAAMLTTGQSALDIISHKVFHLLQALGLIHLNLHLFYDMKSKKLNLKYKGEVR